MRDDRADVLGRQANGGSSKIATSRQGAVDRLEEKRCLAERGVLAEGAGYAKSVICNPGIHTMRDRSRCGIRAGGDAAEDDLAGGRNGRAALHEEQLGQAPLVRLEQQDLAAVEEVLHEGTVVGEDELLSQRSRPREQRLDVREALGDRLESIEIFLRGPSKALTHQPGRLQASSNRRNIREWLGGQCLVAHSQQHREELSGQLAERQGLKPGQHALGLAGRVEQRPLPRDGAGDRLVPQRLPDVPVLRHARAHVPRAAAVVDPVARRVPAHKVRQLAARVHRLERAHVGPQRALIDALASLGCIIWTVDLELLLRDVLGQRGSLLHKRHAQRSPG
eukprot:m.72140 g.72140  ORF g.72140 m.72140 type:complete len:336 (+) comp7666_c0_seq2:44-1051(+)